MTTGVFKRHIEIYVQTACKSGGYFTFEANYGKSIFYEDGITIMGYFGLSALEQRVYDNKV